MPVVDYTTELAGSQDGRQRVSAPQWVSELDPQISATFDGFINWRLQLGLQFQLYPGGIPAELPGVLQPCTLLLRIIAGAVGSDIFVRPLALMTSPTLAAFSDANLPTLAAQVLPWARLGGFAPWALAPTFTVPRPGGLSSFELDLTGSGDLGAFNWVEAVRDDPTWNGKLCLLIRLDAVGDGSNGFTVVASESALTPPPTLSLTEVVLAPGAESVETGWQTGSQEPHTRAIHSMRSGFPALSHEMVEDGYLPGVWVLPHESDPEDDFEFDTYVSSPSEGATINIPAK